MTYISRLSTFALVNLNLQKEATQHVLCVVEFHFFCWTERELHPSLQCAGSLSHMGSKMCGAGFIHEPPLLQQKQGTSYCLTENELCWTKTKRLVWFHRWHTASVVAPVPTPVRIQYSIYETSYSMFNGNSSVYPDSWSDTVSCINIHPLERCHIL